MGAEGWPPIAYFLFLLLPLWNRGRELGGALIFPAHRIFAVVLIVDARKKYWPVDRE